MAAPIEALLTERYPAVAARVLAPLIDTMALAREEHGDLDRLLILLTLAQRAYTEPAVAEALLTQRATPDLTPRATNILSLAQAIHLPKETVRRKLNELIEMGCAVRQSRGVAITPEGVRQLRNVRASLIRMIAAHHEIVERLKLAA
ncbi:hypothetical protein LRS10_08140 [Phenylobacterium sp. J426]|uniref:hypothetical protein n=1 Tax=Phenylobacterium sp. J426 TaxID=2898439 RepID=UPI002150A40A|nr:hypothetical protein [Phenylobacterium sp. J426]MCR5874133.1 hypothetical protein [Phenylobacterium sp. J426]